MVSGYAFFVYGPLRDAGVCGFIFEVCFRGVDWRFRSMEVFDRENEFGNVSDFFYIKCKEDHGEIEICMLRIRLIIVICVIFCVDSGYDFLFIGIKFEQGNVF